MPLSQSVIHLSTRLAAAVLLLAACGTPFAASDASGEGLTFGVKIYGWLPSLSGDVVLEARDVSGEIDVDAAKIIDALQLTFMGAFEARRGRWAGFIQT